MKHINFGAQLGEPFDVFVVYEGEDERGGGRPSPDLVFTLRASADEAAKGKGYYGSNATVESRRAVRTQQGFFLLGPAINDIDRIQSDYKERVRLQALEKLSDEEKRILGVA